MSVNPKRSELVVVAKELNEVLGIDPPIDLDLSRTQLKAKVRQASQLVTAQDRLKASTRELVDQFVAEAKEEEEPEAEEEGAEEEEEDAEEAPEEEEEDAEEAPEEEEEDAEEEEEASEEESTTDNEETDMATSKKKTSKKKASKKKASAKKASTKKTSTKKTAKKGTSKKTGAKKSGAKKAVGRPRGDSMASFMSDLVTKTTDPKKLVAALDKEAKKRGLDKAPTLGQLRSHVKFRQSKGQLKGITIPEPK